VRVGRSGTVREWTALCAAAHANAWGRLGRLRGLRTETGARRLRLQAGVEEGSGVVLAVVRRAGPGRTARWRCRPCRWPSRAESGGSAVPAQQHKEWVEPPQEATAGALHTLLGVACVSVVPMTRDPTAKRHSDYHSSLPATRALSGAHLHSRILVRGVRADTFVQQLLCPQPALHAAQLQRVGLGGLGGVALGRHGGNGEARRAARHPQATRHLSLRRSLRTSGASASGCSPSGSS
jgi:hypothetical protein